NRFVGGASAATFEGGGLIWGYATYNGVYRYSPSLGFGETVPGRVEGGHYNSTWKGKGGNPMDLYPSRSSLLPCDSCSPNSNSRTGLNNGISYTNFAVSTDTSHLSFNVTYGGGTPQVYNYYLPSASPMKLSSLHGNVFVGTDLNIVQTDTLFGGTHL